MLDAKTVGWELLLVVLLSVINDVVKNKFDLNAGALPFHHIAHLGNLWHHVNFTHVKGLPL